MTKQQVEQVLKKIDEAKVGNPYSGLLDEHTISLINIARCGAFQLCEMYIKHYLLTEENDN